MAKTNLTAKYLREILNYDPETGIFTWRIKRRTSRFKPGDIAGTPAAKGHLAIKIDGQSYKAHRLAWLYMIGEWPTDQIDHKNRVPNDNRFANLRDCNTATNCQNQGIRKNNRSGFKGIWKIQNRWKAAISVEMKRIYLGSFDTPEKASEAYMTAVKLYHVSL